MTEAKPCIMCGKSTTRVVFENALAGIYVCSRGCELEYLESLRHRKEEQQQILLRYLDNKIARTRKYSQVGWASAAVGIVWILLGVFFTRLSLTKDLEVGVLLFIIGVFMTTSGALSTCYFDDRKKKLTETRGRLT